jgi:DNA-binding NarL/FixJ family response regulator
LAWSSPSRLEKPYADPIRPNRKRRRSAGLRRRPRLGNSTDLLDELTGRERQILELLATGSSNKDIAREISLSEKTVKHYMTNILQKLQVRNRVEAALLAQKVAHRKNPA